MTSDTRGCSAIDSTETLRFPCSVHDKKYVSHSRDPYAKYESYDGPAGGYNERERVPEAHQSTSHYHHYSRYSDVAPK